MSAPMQVYRWMTFRGGKQTHEIMAASSAAQVMRATGLTRGDWKHSGGVTKNEYDCAIANENQGVVLSRPLSGAGPHGYRRVNGTGKGAPLGEAVFLRTPLDREPDPLNMIEQINKRAMKRRVIELLTRHSMIGDDVDDVPEGTLRCNWTDCDFSIAELDEDEMHNREAFAEHQHDVLAKAGLLA